MSMVEGRPLQFHVTYTVQWLVVVSRLRSNPNVCAIENDIIYHSSKI